MRHEQYTPPPLFADHLPDAARMAASKRPEPFKYDTMREAMGQPDPRAPLAPVSAPEAAREKLTGQNATVLEMLQRGPVTPVKAWAIGIQRLAARIGDLRSKGYAIETRHNPESGWTEYTLVEETQQ